MSHSTLRWSKKTVFALLFSFSFSFIPRNVLQSIAIQQSIGSLVRIEGTVKCSLARDLVSLSGPHRMASDQRIREQIGINDQIQTGLKSFALLELSGGFSLWISEKTTVRFEMKENHWEPRVTEGVVHFIKSQMTWLKLRPNELEFILPIPSLAQVRPPKQLKLLPPSQVASGDLPILTRIQHLNISRSERVEVRSPVSESFVDIEKDRHALLSWKSLQAGLFEVSVRPAFQYAHESNSETKGVVTTSKQEHEVAKVTSNGVYLWSVRAVDAKENRGPSSTPQWIEVRFPEELMAPTVGHRVK